MPATFDATMLVTTVLLGVRLSVVAALMPLISGRSVPVVWRLALAGVMAAAVAPAAAAELPPGPLVASWTDLAGEALRGLAVGALLSFVIGIPFAAVRFAGQLIGVQIGFAMVNTLDPQGGMQITVLSQLYYLMAVLLFFVLDLHHLMVRAMLESCRIVPLFGSLDAGAGSWHIVSSFGEFFRLGLIVAAPVMIVLLLVSASFGFIVKTVPQLNILIVGFPIKIAVGLAMTGVSLVFFARVFSGLADGMETRLAELLGALRA